MKVIFLLYLIFILRPDFRTYPLHNMYLHHGQHGPHRYRLLCAGSDLTCVVAETCRKGSRAGGKESSCSLSVLTLQLLAL